MPELGIQNVVMDFPGVRALDDVSIDFREGEVHGVVGENGAGKSTLMRILSGIQTPSAGFVFHNGANVQLIGVRHAQSLGISMIHQELNLVDELSVADNIFLGRELTRNGLLDRVEMTRQATAGLAEVHAPFAPDVLVGELTIASKQLVEIAKSITADARILIMDEPTAVLSEPESQALFALITRLKARGVTIIYVSHRLEEVCSLCDRITVLRDGKHVTTLEAAGTNPGALADLMVGRAITDFFPPKLANPTESVALRVRLRDGTEFTTYKGEILGFAGLVGAGRTELGEAIFGLRPNEGVEVEIEGKRVAISNPKQGKWNGIVYVSEDRKHLGLHTSLSVVQNLSLANLSKFGRFVLNTTEEEVAAQSWKETLDIRTSDVRNPVSSLSGGNQQKVSVGKWLETRPRILILDEPTRGVDVGAKREMYNLIQKLASEGLVCIVISSDLPEIIGLCNRAIVMREGRIVGELSNDQLTEEAVMRLAAGVVAA